MKIIAIEEGTFNEAPLAAMFLITAQRWQKRMTRLLHPYQPSRHYMRGPGPKWREKHGFAGE